MNSEFLNSDLFTWVVLPLLIFLARVGDVSLSTLRIIYISRGRKYLAPILGFFEVLIWLLAIGQIFKNLDNVACFIAYAGGFAMGNFVGIYMDNKIALGVQVVRIITSKSGENLIQSLQSSGYGITAIDGQGMYGPVKVIFTLIKRRDLNHVIQLIQKYNPRAFFSVEDVRLAHQGVYPADLPESKSFISNWIKFERKGK